MKSPQPPIYVWQQTAWPQWTYDLEALTNVLAHARQQQGMVIGKAQAVGLTSDYLTSVINQIWINEVMATAAIEGQQLNLDWVRSSVMRKLGMANSSQSSPSVDGLVDVMFDANLLVAQQLDTDRLCRWQSALFPGGTSGIYRIEVGKFRTFPEPMQIVGGKMGQEKVYYQAPESSRVPEEMEQFINWFNHPNNLDGIIRAAIAHIWFETIHPFEDGNGRIGRAIIEMTITQDMQYPLRLYSMSRQLQENRADYYHFLNDAQKGNLDITSWIKWFLTQFSAACQQSSVYIDQAVEKARFWANHAGKTFNERQRKILQKLLDAGDGGFLGGLTADKYVKITGASKATATRDLTDLLQKEALVIAGQGKATKYYVNVPGWNSVI